MFGNFEVSSFSKKTILILVWMVSLSTAGCASSSSSVETPQYSAQQILKNRKSSKKRMKKSKRARSRFDASGILGTISQSQVEKSIAKKMDAALQCFVKELETLPYLNGEVQLAFRIFESGKVKTVFPEYSNLGSSGLENCLIDIMAKIEFPKPKGGEAEFSHTLYFDLQDDVRPPGMWNPIHATQALGEVRDQVYQSCHLQTGGALKVTAYILPEGQVFSLGVSSESFLVQNEKKCVLEKIKIATFPKPGPYPVKLTFSL